MRIIRDTNQRFGGIEDEDYAAEVEAAVEQGEQVRLSSYTDRDGMTWETEVRQFEDPRGGVRWAVRAQDPQNFSLQDSEDRAEVEAAYEELVRGMAGTPSKGDPPYWAETDVAETPFGAVRCVVEHRRDGEWEEHSNTERALGELIDPDSGRLEHTSTMENMAHTLLADAEEEASVSRDSEGVDRVRVTVSSEDPSQGEEQVVERDVVRLI